MGGLIELSQGGARDHRHRMPTMSTHLPGRDAGLQTELDPVMTTLRAAAVITGLGDGAIGQMPTRAYRRGGGFDIAAGFGVDPAVQPRHSVRALGAQHQTTAPGAVGLIEEPVGVEDLIDMRARRP